VAGRNRVHIASMQKTPRSRASVTRSCAVVPDAVNGFSTSTGVPASMAARAEIACEACGVATYTTSTLGSSASARTSVQVLW